MTNLVVIPAGIAIGILTSAPVGPVNIICIGRAFRYGFVPAWLAGIGAAIGDGVLALVAVFGIGVIADAITNHTGLIQSVGATILIIFGLYVMMSTPHGSPRAEAHMADSGMRIIPATFLITITNPGALLGFFAIFGGIIGNRLLPEGDWTSAILMVVSVAGGALLWWTGIAGFVARIRHLISDQTLRRINIVSGFLLAAIGVAILVKVALRHFGLL